MIPVGSGTARRVLTAGLVAAGLLVLLVRALRAEPPLAYSLASIRAFWSANPPTRLLNSPAFTGDRELGVTLLHADRQWPMDRDVVVVFPASWNVWAAQRMYEKAAFILAPRRVTMRRDGAKKAVELMLAPER